MTLPHLFMEKRR